MVGKGHAGCDWYACKRLLVPIQIPIPSNIEHSSSCMWLALNPKTLNLNPEELVDVFRESKNLPF